MITGSVNSRREAIIQLDILGPDGQRQTVDAVIDTGFNGFLTLPAQAVAALGLRRFGSVRVVLVDGSEDLFPTYKATVEWDGAPRDVEVDAADSDPLAGMALLAMHELHIQVVAGGHVTIEAMP
jgi:clan AA aspartic protease